MNGFTIVDAPPESKRGRPQSQYASALDAALEHEGRWVRLDEYRKTTKQAARNAAGALWGAAKTARARQGLRGSFTICVREDAGHWYVYLRKNPAGEKRS